MKSINYLIIFDIHNTINPESKIFPIFIKFFVPSDHLVSETITYFRYLLLWFIIYLICHTNIAPTSLIHLWNSLNSISYLNLWFMFVIRYRLYERTGKKSFDHTCLYTVSCYYICLAFCRVLILITLAKTNIIFTISWMTLMNIAWNSE